MNARNTLSPAQRAEVVKWVTTGTCSEHQAAKHFGVPLGTIHRLLVESRSLVPVEKITRSDRLILGIIHRHGITPQRLAVLLNTCPNGEPHLG